MRVLFAMMLLFAWPAAAEEKLDASEFLEILPDALAHLELNLQMAYPDTSGKVFYMAAVSISSGFLAQKCDLRVFLRNRFDLSTIDNLTLVLTSHDESGERLGIHEVMFRYVDPGDTDSVGVKLDEPCLDLSYVRPREVTACRAGVFNLTDCLGVFPSRIDVISFSKAVETLTTPPED